MTDIKRVYKKHGAWHYVDLNKKWHYLCRVSDGDVAKLQAYLALINTEVDPTMVEIIDEWKRERLSEYTGETRKEYVRSAEIFKIAFAKFRVKDVKTVDLNKFIYSQWRDAPNMANKMVDRLKQIFTIAIAKGLRETNPCDSFDRKPYRMKTDKRALKRHEIEAIRAAALAYPKVRGKHDSGHMFVCMLDMGMHIWQRGQEIRTLTEFQVQSGYLRLKPSKTEESSGLSVDVKITPEIQEILDRARRIKKERGIPACSWLFPTLGGTAYTRSGLQQLWNKYKGAAGVDTPLTFKHLRPFGATEAYEQGVSIEEISVRLVHGDVGTTKKYLRSRVPKKSELDFKPRPVKLVGGSKS